MTLLMKAIDMLRYTHIIIVLSITITRKHQHTNYTQANYSCETYFVNWKEILTVLLLWIKLNTVLKSKLTLNCSVTVKLHASVFFNYPKTLIGQYGKNVRIDLSSNYLHFARAGQYATIMTQ